MVIRNDKKRLVVTIIFARDSVPLSLMVVRQPEQKKKKKKEQPGRLEVRRPGHQTAPFW
jgi:hypothetical protein